MLREEPKKRFREKSDQEKILLKQLNYLSRKTGGVGGNIFEVCIFKNEICTIFHKLSSQIFYPLKTPVGGYIFLSKHLINF